MDTIFPVAAFAAAFLGVRRSLGLGFVAVFTTGYFNGVIRANFLGVFTTFMFDAALLGLYLGTALGHPALAREVWASRAGRFCLFLIGWPALLSLVPINDLLVQLVALRATVFFLPVLLIATGLSSADLRLMARGLAVLNLVALAAGVYVYHYGVEALYPENAVTYIIYASKDVAGFTYHRVPSTFLSAHAYGGAMLFSLPLLLDRLCGVGSSAGDRVLAGAGVAAALIGILLCAARTPIVMFGVAAAIACVITRFNLYLALVAAVIGLVGAGMAATDERLQRAADLDEREMVSERVQGSANESFLGLLAEYPAGAGMGSSVGTNIPFFLVDRAPKGIGLENEYSRILIDQGIVGLAGWVAFVGWLFVVPPPVRLRSRWGLGVVLMYALCLTNWLTAFIGAGTLSAVPGSVLLLTQMGVLVAVRGRAEPEAAA
jgi:hypothetical protein